MTSKMHKAGEPPEPHKPRRIFGGLIEGFRNRRERSAASDLIDAAISDGGPEELSSAIEKLCALEPESREKVLLRMQGRLEGATAFPFESETKVRIITVAAELFAAAAPKLPRNENGALETAQFSRATSVFKRVSADNNLYESGNHSHCQAKLSCAKALWELEAGSGQFWEERIVDTATSEFTIERLLDLGKEDKTADGWPILKTQLSRIALDIAASQSGRTAEFFTSMLMDSDPKVLRAALAGSLYLEDIPPEFSDIAGDISRLGSGLDFDAFVFTEASRFREMLHCADERQFEGAKGLISLYMAGAGHLAPLLHYVGVDMAEVILEPSGADEEAMQRQRNSAGEVLGHLALAGIALPKIPGFQIDIKFDIQKEG